jgi:c-di-AMP phosphodiesterase-like protein
MNQDIFWINNPKILIDKYNEIIPNNKMTIITLYNTITRCLIYLIIISYLLFNNIGIIIILIIIIIYIIMLNNNNNNNNNNINNNKINNIQQNNETECRDSTINNPMANPYVVGSKLNIKACKNLDSLKVLNNLRFNVYEDSNRPQNIKILERSYYTLPVTDYPNDINSFIDELYKTSKKSCKKDAENCDSYRDLRFIR